MFGATHSAKLPIWALAVMTSCLGQGTAFAAPADDLSAIRDAITNLRQDYEAKIKDLEDRLQKAQAEAEAAKASADSARAAAEDAQKNVAAAQPAAPEPQARAPASANALNPGIAAVLNGFYVGASRDPATARIPGFALGDSAQGPPRGFSLGESEVALSANIDPFFFGSMTLSFGNDGTVSVEEAFIQTGSVADGVTLKAGRFFSGVGYLNERHSHNWTFSDMPLPYRAFLNTQYGDDGIQARWLAPTNIFLEFGAEWYRGDAFPAGNGANQGKGTATAFVHAGSDISDSSSWLGALSFVHARADSRDTGGDVFSGTDNIGIASLVYKWAPGGNPVVQNFAFSGEYFYGHESGLFNGIKVDYNRSGWYAQGVYQFMPRWSVGLRYAELEAARVGAALVGSTLDDLGHTPRAVTALLEFDTTEFTRLRVQYTRDDSDRRPLDEIFLQYTVVYGPHDAHRY
jgi:hypothetical protein